MLAIMATEKVDGTVLDRCSNVSTSVFVFKIRLLRLSIYNLRHKTPLKVETADQKNTHQWYLYTKIFFFYLMNLNCAALISFNVFVLQCVCRI